MQFSSKPIKMKLTEDLTRYNPSAKIGAVCHTIPNFACSMWGENDRFVAVEFEDGSRLDVLYRGLTRIEEDVHEITT